MTPPPLKLHLRSTEPFDFHWFAFFQGWEEDRKLKAHHLRDGVAFGVLNTTLLGRGGRYAGRFRNGPATRDKVEQYRKLMQDYVDTNQPRLIEDIVDYRPVDESFLSPGVLLEATTRLPMDDFAQENKVVVQPGFTSLEEKLIRACRLYLPICARSRVRIADGLADCLPTEFANRADISYLRYSEPWYDTLSTLNPSLKKRQPKADRRRTMVYLLQLPAVETLNGADLLVAWGQGGTQTLALAELLQDELSHLLDCYGFSMVELTAPGYIQPKRQPEKPYELLDSMGDWKSDVVLKGVLLDSNGQAVRERETPPSGERPMKKAPSRAPSLEKAGGDD